MIKVNLETKYNDIEILNKIRNLLGLSTQATHGEIEIAYTALDQKIKKETGIWDYKDKNLVTNKVKDWVEKLEGELDDDLKEILWLWYHHSVSTAIWKYHDRQQAIIFVEKALQYKNPKNPNPITKLFQLLLEDKINEAEQHVGSASIDKDTASELLKEYKEDRFGLGLE